MDNKISIYEYCKLKGIEKSSKFFYAALLSSEHVIFNNKENMYGYSRDESKNYFDLSLSRRILLLKMAMSTESEWDRLLEFVPRFEKFLIFS